jgi:hypothetical protein
MKIQIRGEGEVSLLGKSHFVPQLKFGLISISKLDKDKYIAVVADQKLSIVDDDSNTLLTATEKDGLYYLDEYYLRKLLLRRKQPRVYLCESALIHNQSDDQERINNEFYKLHHKWGHLSESRMKLAYKNNLVDGIKQLTPEQFQKAELKFCYDCMRGRMKAQPHGLTTNHEHDLFEKVAVDYKGPFKVKSREGYSGFYLYSDYSSNYIWVCLVYSKDNFLATLDLFYKHHIVKYRKKLVTLQSDSDSVIQGKEVMSYLHDKGNPSIISTICSFAERTN